MYKNVADQLVPIYAHDTATDQAKTGDAANITAQISKDGGASAATNDANPAELDATDHPGVYLFTLTQAESNADLVVLTARSSTSNVSIEPVFIYTKPTLADINAECDTALSDYDPPTKAEMDAALAALNDLSAAEVNAELDTALADYDPPTKAEMDAAIAAIGAGGGAVTFTYTLTSDVDASPIPDARVWVTSDADGLVNLASGRTNANGQVTFHLDPGTIYLWRQKAGWNFTNPDEELVPT